MGKNINRRNFIKKSIGTSLGISAGLSFEHIPLLSKEARKPSIKLPKDAVKGLQMGKIGKYNVSRITCGGNLISGFAHSRDLIYVSSLLKHYFTDDKVIETLRICEENGINTAILRCDPDTIRLLKRYWNEEGGKIQWIAQTYPKPEDITSNIQMAIDNGAIGAYSQGGFAGDELYKKGQIDIIAKVVEFIKQNGLIAGVGSHMLEVTMASEEKGFDPDFYVKTLNNDVYYCKEPEKLFSYMKKVKKPWIAFKVLGAGVTEPRRGFRYAFENGADFINIGMYDFQIKEDVLLTKRLLSGTLKRERAWCA